MGAAEGRRSAPGQARRPSVPSILRSTAPGATDERDVLALARRARTTPPRSASNLEREFPEGASELPEGVTRREMLMLLGRVALARGAGVVPASGREDRPVRQRAGGDHPRRAAPLRDDDAVRPQRLRARRRKPRRPPDQDRRERAASRDDGPLERAHRRRRSSGCTTPTARSRSCTTGRPRPGPTSSPRGESSRRSTSPTAAPRSPCSRRRSRRRRAPACCRRSSARFPQGARRGPRAGLRRERPRGVTAPGSRSAGAPPRQGRRDRLRSTPTSSGAIPKTSATSPGSRPAAARRSTAAR